MRSLIVSPAKSGSTALLYMLANAQATQHIYNEEALTTLRDLPKNCVAKLILENQDQHALFICAQQFSHKILLLRDPRDNFVSRLLYRLANCPSHLADDAFLNRFLSLLQQKQAAPNTVDFLTLDQFAPPEMLLVGAKSKARIENYRQFVINHPVGWYLMYYEDMVAGNFLGLNRYLDLSISPVKIPADLARVVRTKASGDWRDWLTANDVQVLRPLLAPSLQSMGYEDEWELAAQPTILPQHCQEYVLRLIHERRKRYQLPPYIPQI